MKQEMLRERVKGFLDVDGRKIVNGDKEEIILTGWGLGNWLLCEGYMWRAYGGDRFDRPRRIETVVEELAGREYAEKFWKRFRDLYITEEDIRYMAELGYNSVRLPMNARLFVSEEPGEPVFLEEGFALVDRCIEWCKKYGLYVFLDLHGAPGGQTGANIDDSIDDMPRLFMDQDKFDKGIALWREIARRYKDEWIVGGYDLLNEPLRPKRFDKDISVDCYLPRLQEFYEKAIAAVREVDQKHLFTLEGHHWATDTSVFTKKYDEKMVLHFHRYGCQPDILGYEEFLKTAERLNCPLWLGETGENENAWYTAMYQLAGELSIGYNIWPWKKMSCTNSPCSVKMPADWNLIMGYANRGAHPGAEKAQEILDEYLENMKLANCELHPEVTDAILRRPGCVIRGTDFDEFPGKGVSCSGTFPGENLYRYRMGMGMEIRNKFPDYKTVPGFDSGWGRFVLALGAGEFACYSLNDIREGSSLQLEVFADRETDIQIMAGEEVLAVCRLQSDEKRQVIGPFSLKAAERDVIRVTVLSGEAEIERILTFQGK